MFRLLHPTRLELLGTRVVPYVVPLGLTVVLTSEARTAIVRATMASALHEVSLVESSLLIGMAGCQPP